MSPEGEGLGAGWLLSLALARPSQEQGGQSSQVHFQRVKTSWINQGKEADGMGWRGLKIGLVKAGWEKVGDCFAKEFWGA